MDPLKIKSDKEVSDETKAKRSKIILAIMAVMIAAVVFIPGHRKNRAIELSPEEFKLEQTLDSVLISQGFPDYEVYYKGKIETLTENIVCPDEEQLAAIQLRIDIITSNTMMSEKEKITKLDAALKERDKVEKQIAEFYANGKDLTYKSRRIRFTTPDGRKYTFFQQLYPRDNTVKPAYLMDITNSTRNAKEEYNKIQNK